MKTEDKYGYLNSRIYLNLVGKEVEKNLGMLRSYSTEENSGNRSRQLLREVRTQHKDSSFKFWRSSWLDDRLLIIIKASEMLVAPRISECFGLGLL